MCKHSVSKPCLLYCGLNECFSKLPSDKMQHTQQSLWNMVGANRLRMMMTVQEAIGSSQTHTTCTLTVLCQTLAGRFPEYKAHQGLVTVLACMEYTIVAGSRVFMNNLTLESTGFQPQYYPERTHTLDVSLMCFSYHVRPQFICCTLLT